MSTELMKAFALLLCLLVSGCGSLAADRMFSNNLLDTAPRNDSEVLYPDWRTPSQPTRSEVVPNAVAETRKPSRPSNQVQEPASLLAFLADHRIDYELQPGEHSIVKLKRSLQFQTGAAQLSSESIRWVGELGRFLAQKPTIDVIVEGHTDNTGSERLNDGLSLRRAEAVKQVLIGQKVPNQAIYTRGYGSHLSKCQNNTAQGRACNRRAELLLIIPEYLTQ
ncbi:OmpA family protein [Vibrio cincinnatiensis]|nr:OmpA family protein [Vibrio cincinnatiensis]